MAYTRVPFVVAPKTKAFQQYRSRCKAFYVIQLT